MDTIALLVLICLGFNFLPSASTGTEKAVVKWWEPNKLRVEPSSGTDLKIICFVSRIQPSLLSLWTTVQFNVEGDGSSEVVHTIYKGPSEESIRHQYESESIISIWSILKPWVTTGGVTVNPFNTTCIGVTDTRDKYTVSLRITERDYWRLSCTLAGLILFFSAPQLSGNILCYYSAGISFGVLASALIIIFIISKFIPRKTGAYLFLTAGFSLSAYILQSIWSQAAYVLEEHKLVVCAYFVVAGLVSFAVCYYKGPVTNPRLLSLIQWTIQLISLALIYAGCQITSVSATIIILCVLTYNLPLCPGTRRLGSLILAFWRRSFPPKIRLLTEEEYKEQGRVETEKALAELRDYCNSSKCNAWSTMARLRTPDRFASWASGSSLHITDDEIIEHDLHPSPRPGADLPNRFDPDDMGEEFEDDRHSQSMMFPSSSRYSNQAVRSPSYLANRSMDSVHGFRRNNIQETNYTSSSFTSRR